MRTLSNSTDLAQIAARLRALRPTDRAQWGHMYSSEMVCHIRGAFRMAMGELAPGEVRTLLPYGLMKLLALRMPWSWPKNYGTVPALKRGTAAMLVHNFDAALTSALAELNRFCDRAQYRGDHPYLGSMSTAEWMRWGYLHADHHLRQFER